MTATRNGLYGIYAFSAQNGVIEHSYASGSADSGIYVGQCKPCNIVVRDNVAELNAVGYEGTNASEDMYVVGNRLLGNRVGLTTNSDHQEKLLPQKGSVIAGNLIAANQQTATPEQADGGWGIGMRHRRRQRQPVHPQPHRRQPQRRADDHRDHRHTSGRQPDRGQHVHRQRSRRRLDVPHHHAGTGQLPAGQRSAHHRARPARDDCGLPTSGRVVLGKAGTWAAPTAPGGIPFTEVAGPAPQPQFPDAATADATAVPPVPALPKTEGIRLPPTSLLAAYARVQTP